MGNKTGIKRGNYKVSAENKAETRYQTYLKEIAVWEKKLLKAGVEIEHKRVLSKDELALVYERDVKILKEEYKKQGQTSNVVYKDVISNAALKSLYQSLTKAGIRKQREATGITGTLWEAFIQKFPNNWKEHLNDPVDGTDYVPSQKTRRNLIHGHWTVQEILKDFGITYSNDNITAKKVSEQAVLTSYRKLWSEAYWFDLYLYPEHSRAEAAEDMETFMGY